MTDTLYTPEEPDLSGLETEETVGRRSGTTRGVCLRSETVGV